MPLDAALVGHETAKVLTTIELADVRRFAEAIGDPNPLFSDADYARTLGFPASLTPPTYVVRYLAALGEVGLDEQHTQVLHAEQAYEYTRPLHVGDQLEVWHRVASVRQTRRADGMAILALETLGQTPDGMHVFTGSSKLIVREGTPGADGVNGTTEGGRKATVPDGQAMGTLLKAVTQAQIDAYAGASGDHNPIHTNPLAARAVGLDGTIAHGMLSMAFLGQLITDWLAAQPARGGWLVRLRARFQAMVRPEDTLMVHGVLVAGSEAGHQSVEVWVNNQHGERVTTGDGEVVVMSV
jgi:acyl dehydratase